MTLKKLLIAAAAAVGFLAPSAHAETPREIALTGFKALLQDFDAAVVEQVFAEDYIQHNMGVPTGRAAVLGFLPTLAASGLRPEIHRIIVDGDFVAFHVTYHNAQLFGAETLVAFDVFRIEDGRIAEHWDNLTPLETANPSGRTQTDGPTDIQDREQTEANKAHVASFIEAVLIGGAFDRLTEFVSTESYLQHNSQIADGLDGLAQGLEAMAAQGVTMEYRTLHHVIGEGNFVLTLSEGAFGGAPTAFYDLFRLEKGLIVEHWDVISTIPATAAHENGKF